ncbi:MAG: SufD family Fe-S cluster assembly protein [Deltaproteobacteria bacterium]|nr:MAG: SufD family Fe-S cluster assembly protein [Deltaproteobacteria bacterium]
MRGLDNDKKKLLEKKATYGEDIDLNQFKIDVSEKPYIEDVSKISDQDKEQMLKAGVDLSEKERTGTFIQKDQSVVHCKVKQEGLEVMPIVDALKKYDWLKDYYWKAVSKDLDKYSASADIFPSNGYFIRSLPNQKISYPVQTCLYMEEDNVEQNVHNIIIVEEESELHIITGCTTSPFLNSGLHIGISEFYIKRNSKLSFTMIHNWKEGVHVRPRSATIVEEGGTFLSNYIVMKPLKSLQTYPTTHLVGEGAVARYYSIMVASKNSYMDVGSKVVLHAPNTRAEVISRAITTGGKIIARGRLEGEKPGIKAHLECKGLILKEGIIEAIPELVGITEGVEMSHEAAVGKIAKEEIEYLMARGLSEEEATSTIVRGFLKIDIVGLPSILREEIDKAVAETEKDMF